MYGFLFRFVVVLVVCDDNKVKTTNGIEKSIMDSSFFIRSAWINFGAWISLCVFPCVKDGEREESMMRSIPK